MPKSLSALLLSVRSNIGSALDALDEDLEAHQSMASCFNSALPVLASAGAGCAAQLQARRGKIRQELETASKSLREAEQLAQNREKLAKNRLDSTDQDFNHVSDEETRQWLKTSFAAVKEKVKVPGAQRASCMMQDNSEAGRVKQKASHSFTQKDQQLHSAFGNEDIVQLTKKAGEFDFDALTFHSKELVAQRAICILGVHLEIKHTLIENMNDAGVLAASLKTFQSAFLAFLFHLDALYKPDAIYHGSMHAVDVMSTAMWFMRSEFLASHSKPLDVFVVMMAAAIHDVGHPGVNNLFLTKTQDPLALRYNDKSVLENMHAALAFETMASDSDADWFSLLTSQSQKTSRTNLIGMVLATDMATHAGMVKCLASLDSECQDDIKFIYETVIHCSDICNPAKPMRQMLGWTKRITEEFWTQGDREQQLGLEISPLCERESGMKTVPKGQIGFINFVVYPYLASVKRLINEADAVLNGLDATKDHWEAAAQEDLTYEQIFKDAL